MFGRTLFNFEYIRKSLTCCGFLKRQDSKYKSDSESNIQPKDTSKNSVNNDNQGKCMLSIKVTQYTGTSPLFTGIKKDYKFL